MGRKRDEPPEAITMCLTHLKRIAEESPFVWAQDNKGADERDRARVLLRLCEGGVKKTKYSKAINNLRALLLLIQCQANPGRSFPGQKLEEAVHEVKVQQAGITALLHRLIGHLMKIEGRDECDYQAAYARGQDAVPSELLVLVPPQILRDLKRDLDLPQRKAFGYKNPPAHLIGEEFPAILKQFGMTWPPPSLPPLPAIELPATKQPYRSSGSKTTDEFSLTQFQPKAVFEFLKHLFDGIIDQYAVHKMKLHMVRVSMDSEVHIQTVGLCGLEKGEYSTSQWSWYMGATPPGLSIVSGTMQLANDKFTLFVPLIVDVPEGGAFSATIPRGSNDIKFYRGCLGCIEFHTGRMTKGFGNPADRENVFAVASVAARLLDEFALLEIRTAQMYTTVQASISMFWNLDYTQMIQQFQTAIELLFKVEMCDIYTVGFNEKTLSYELKLANHDPQSEPRREPSVPFGEGVSGGVADSGAAANLRNAHLDSRYNPRYDRGGTLDAAAYDQRSILSVPMRTRSKKMIGVVQLTNRRDGQTFGDDDQAILQGLADSTAQAMDAVRAHQEREKEIKEKETTFEDMLQESSLRKDKSKQAGLRLMSAALNHLMTAFEILIIQNFKKNFQKDHVDAVKKRLKVLSKQASDADDRNTIVSCEKDLEETRKKYADMQMATREIEKNMQTTNSEEAQKSVRARTFVNGYLESSQCECAKTESEIELKAAELALMKAQAEIENLKNKVAQQDEECERVRKKQHALEMDTMGVQWSWKETGADEMVPYPQETNVLVELGFQDYLRHDDENAVKVDCVSILQNKLLYTVNYDRMIQTNIVNGSERSVSRVDYKEAATDLTGKSDADKVMILMDMPLKMRQVVLGTLPKSAQKGIQLAASKMGMVMGC